MAFLGNLFKGRGEEKKPAAAPAAPAAKPAAAAPAKQTAAAPPSSPPPPPPPAETKPPAPAPKPAADLSEIMSVLQKIEEVMSGPVDAEPAAEVAGSRLPVVRLPLAEMAKLAPAAFNPAAGKYGPDETAEVIVEDLFGQLAKGRVTTTMKYFLVDVPRHYLIDGVDLESAEPVDLPLPLLVSCISPEELRSRTTSVSRDLGVKNMPSLFKTLAEEKEPEVKPVTKIPPPAAPAAKPKAAAKPAAPAKAPAEPAAAPAAKPKAPAAAPKTPAVEAPKPAPVPAPAPAPAAKAVPAPAPAAKAVPAPAPAAPPAKEAPKVAAKAPAPAPAPAAPPAKEAPKVAARAPAPAPAPPAPPAKETLATMPKISLTPSKAAKPLAPPPTPAPLAPAAPPAAEPKAPPLAAPVAPVKIPVPAAPKAPVAAPPPVAPKPPAPAPAAPAAKPVAPKAPAAPPAKPAVTPPPAPAAKPVPPAAPKPAVAPPPKPAIAPPAAPVTPPKLQPLKITEMPVAAEARPVPVVAKAPAAVAPAQKMEVISFGVRALMFRGVDMNAVEAVELTRRFDGIGDALAERIVQDRATNGPFFDISDLARVPGVGGKTFEKITGRPWQEDIFGQLATVHAVLGPWEGKFPDLQSVVTRFKSQPGFEGCVVLHKDGDLLASSWAIEDRPGLEAMAPQVVKRVAQYMKRIKSGEPLSVTVNMDETYLTFVQNKDICFIAVHNVKGMTRRHVQVACGLGMALGNRFSGVRAAS